MLKEGQSEQTEKNESESISSELKKVCEYYLGNELEVPSDEDISSVQPVIFPEEKGEFWRGKQRILYPEEVNKLGYIFHAQEYDAVDHYDPNFVKNYLNEKEISLWKEYVLLKRIFNHIWEGVLQIANEVNRTELMNSRTLQEKYPDFSFYGRYKTDHYHSKGPIFISHSFHRYFQNVDPDKRKSDKSIEDMYPDFSTNDGCRLLSQISSVEGKIQEYFDKKFPQLRVASSIYFLKHADNMSEQLEAYQNLPTETEYQDMLKSGELPTN